MEEIHESKSERRTRTSVRRRIPPNTQKVRPMGYIAFFGVIAPTKRNVDGMVPSGVVYNEVLHSRLGVMTRQASVSQVDA